MPKIENFKSKFFWARPKQTISKVNVGLNPEHRTGEFEGMKVMAFGFIDSDMKNDIVTTNAKQSHFQVHFFDGSTN